MKVIIATPPGRFPGNKYPCPFPSRWTSVAENYPVFIFYPYQLAYLSTLLKQDLPQLHIKMIDGTWLRFDVAEYVRFLEIEAPDYLVFETDTVTYKQSLRVALEIKKKLGTKIIMTGQYATVFPEKVLQDGCDYACIGEYEETVRDLLRGDEAKNIQGLYPNSYRTILDINSLPDPEDEDISRIDYSYSGAARWLYYREIEMFASRGCPYSCDFCVAGSVYYEKTNWRPREPKRIIAEIEALRKKYPRMQGVFFDEETHIVKKKYTLELCEAIIRSGNNDLYYDAMANYQLLDEEILIALKKAGYYKLRVGIESIDESTGSVIGTKTDPNHLENILRIAKKLGIEMYGSFIVGAAGSSKEADSKTIDFGVRLISEGFLSSWQASIAVPHPGTPFYDEAIKQSWLQTDDIELFNGSLDGVVSYPHYSNKEIKETEQIMRERFIKANPDISGTDIRSAAREETVLSDEEQKTVEQETELLAKLFQEHKYREVVDKGEELLRKFPYSLNARHIVASSYKFLAETENAIAGFEFIVNACDDFGDALNFASGAHFHLGDIFLKQGKKEKALRNFKLCMHLNPNHQSARQNFWNLIQ
ncbi:MAG: radical SAM protein [Nitrospinae bacterium]|nr:radical SAM protein [Nitrospinota bacterium]